MVTSSNSLVIHQDDLHAGSAKRAQASGVASLDAAGKVPVAQVGAVELTTNKGIASGYAGLDAGSKVAVANLPLNSASGVAGLDAGSKVAVANLPVDVASGIAGLDAGVLLSLAQQQLNFKIGTFSKNTADVTGQQAITGVGFRPRLVIFFVAVTLQAGEMSVGFDSGAAAYSISDAYQQSANTYIANTGQSIYLYQSGAIGYYGAIASMDADGFTINWTKVGAKTGTAAVKYLAIK